MEVGGRLGGKRKLFCEEKLINTNSTQAGGKEKTGGEKMKTNKKKNMLCRGSGPRKKGDRSGGG